jgi:hypothetical protein
MKDIVKQKTGDYIAKTIAIQLKANKDQEKKQPIKLDVRLSLLKPFVCKWITDAVSWMQSKEGTQLILAGFEKAGIDQVWLRSFQVNLFIVDLN